ncbi:MAG: GntP family permease [Deltaproteobacteria bacterium]|jgi:H+/gluconate symporter-like permease|nr:GntP family permease [Deltaproteobacteria bacterium]
MVIGIIISLLLLTIIAYRGFSVIVFAPLCAILAAITAGWDPLPTYTNQFMGSAVVYVKNFFPIFMLGGVFGKIVEESGAAYVIAKFFARTLGEKYTMLAVIMTGVVLTYGGVSLFVVVFAVYPLAATMFREFNIPKRLIPAAVILGSATATMTAFPGTPAIQNIIPTQYFGTNAFAAPTMGIISGVLILALGTLWLQKRAKSLMARGETYYSMHDSVNEPAKLEGEQEAPMSTFQAFLPLFAVLILNFVFTKLFEGVSPDVMATTAKAPLAAGKPPVATWALICALIAGILLMAGMGWKRLKKGNTLMLAINAGAIGSLLAIMNTASEVGYGNVISNLPGFKDVSSFLLSIDPGTPLLSEALTVNILAGITGSASGGMSIALEAMGSRYLEWANQLNLSPEILHRIAALSSGGFDSLPHNGAVITILTFCGINHKAGYPDIGMVSVIIPFVLTGIMIVMATVTGIY